MRGARRRQPALSLVLVVSCGLGVGSAQATTFAVGETEVRIGGAVGAGTMIRTGSPDPALVSRANGALVGLPATSPAGRNGDDGNINWRRGDAVSTVLKALLDLEVKHGSFGAFVRTMAWRDFALTDGGRPWGNIPNNYTPGIPLGESSNSSYGRYSGAALLDANVYGTVHVGSMPLHARIGYQLVPWGAPSTIFGGLSVLNPVNQPALRRPGVLPEEVGIPFPAVFTRVGLTSTINLEAFYQFKFQRTEPLGCGTFFSSLDYLAERCDKVVFGAGLTDPASLAQVNYAKRAPDDEPDGGQFGVGLTHRMEVIATQFGAYFAQYHQRGGLIGVVKSLRPGNPFLAGDPNGLNPKYFVTYPENVRMLALNAITSRPGFSAFAEVVHRFNQPLQLNSADVTAAATSDTAPSLLRSEYSAVPLGGIFLPYDRFATTDVLLGSTRDFAGVLGARTTTLGGEAGLKYVHNLPDPNVRRYGRADTFGSVPVNGNCAVVAPGLTCSNDGFVSPLAYGARVRGALRYADLLPGIDVTPSAGYGYDIQGWSYDGAFSEGKHFAFVALRAEHRKRYVAEITYQPTWGGRYNLLRDRSMMTLSLTARF